MTVEAQAETRIDAVTRASVVRKAGDNLSDMGKFPPLW
jgi:hypothetical protein